MDHTHQLEAIISADAERLRILALVHALRLPDGWVGGGFLRSAVWDALHRRPASKPQGDVDIIWFDPGRTEPAEDRALETRLAGMDPSIDWSVKNQCRMHLRNGDIPYASAVDAMRHWPETATAVAVRLDDAGHCEFVAPFGFDDLFDLVIRPTPQFLREKYPVYQKRVQTKGWLSTWPRLTLASTPQGNVEKACAEGTPRPKL